MPKYKITGPDGRQFILTGDSPPSQEAINEAYANLPPLDTAQEVTQEPTLMEKIRGISLKDVIKGTSEVIKETPKQVATDVLRLAPIAAGFVPGLGLPAQAGITAVSRAGRGLLEGEEAPEAIQKGVISGAVEAGIGKALKLGKPVAKALEKPAKETAAFVGNILSSVPKESIEKALSNPRILKTKDTYTDLGKKAKDGLQKLLKESGTRKKQETRILKQSEKQFDLSTFVNRQKQLLEKKAGQQSVYTPQERVDINEILDNVKRERSPEGLREIMDQIDNTSQLYKDPATVSKRTTKGDKKLKEISNKIRTQLKTEVQGVSELREQTKEVLEIKEILGKKLAKNKDASKLLKRQQDDVTQEALQKLDDLLPEKNKFLNKSENIKIKEQFSKIFPGQGGGSGGAEGVANLLRVGAGLATTPLALPFISPVAQKAAIGTLPAIGKGLQVAERVIPKATAMAVTPIERQKSGGIAPRSLQQIKKERGL
jgi:hypothetical protein